MASWSLFWIGVLVFFLLAEAATVGLVCLWFAGGALAAAVLSLVGVPFSVQALTFLLISGVLLLLLRPIVRRCITPKIKPTNKDALIGSQGVVLTQVDNLQQTGEVKLGGLVWTARSTSGEPIPAGTTVQVDRIEGVKVYLSPVREQIPM